ncbi:MAG: TadG family pilus assembly protein [Isosphaeraceae bacterium]
MFKRFRISDGRRGTVLVMAACLITVVLIMGACAIDMGFLWSVQTQAQAAADSAALAGARGLPISAAQVLSYAQQAASLNKANGQAVTLNSSDVVLGTWNGNTRTFTAGAQNANAVQVTVNLTSARGNPVGTFFAGAMGIRSNNVSTTATAAVKQWDVVFDQDISESYNTDLSNAVAGTQDALASFQQYAPWSNFGVAQHGGWGSTWASLQPVGANFSSLNTTIGKLVDCANSTLKNTYNVYGGTNTSIAVTTLTPDCCGSDLATGLQQAINMFTSAAYTSSAPPGTRKAIIVSSDGMSNANANGQHGGDTDTQLNTLATQTAATAWNSYGISVFVLLYYHGSDTEDDVTVLRSLVQGEGTYTQVNDASDVPGALQSIIVGNLKYNLVK